MLHSRVSFDVPRNTSYRAVHYSQCIFSNDVFLCLTTSGEIVEHKIEGNRDTQVSVRVTYLRIYVGNA